MIQSAKRSKKQEPPLRIGVVGAGMMGQHHLRVCSMLRGVELTAVADINPSRAKHSAQQYNCLGFTQIEDMVDKVDAVIIAVPSSLHFEVGRFFLNHNIHCLIEKPLAITEAHCLELIALADKKGLILLVGHIEHFNPAVQQLSKILAEGHLVHAIEVQRMGGNNKRNLDVDVIMDLMIHDLEIVVSLLGSKVLDITAQGVSESRNGGVDYVSALLLFSSGAIANLTASRITQNKVRKLSITSDLGYITLDYSAQELLIYRQAKESVLTNSVGYVYDLAMERVFVRPVEPLIEEIQNFVHSITVGTPLGVDGRQALAALRLVWQLQDQVAQKRHRVIPAKIKAQAAKIVKAKAKAKIEEKVK